MPPVIREAKEKDLEDVVEMRKKFLEYHQEYHGEYVSIRDDIEDVLKSEFMESMEDEEELVLIVEEKGETAGFLTASIDDQPDIFEEERIGEIGKLYIREQFRGQGHGKKLEERAEVWFKEKDVELVKARVIKGNSTAQSFWEGKDFEDLLSVKYKQL